MVMRRTNKRTDKRPASEPALALSEMSAHPQELASAARHETPWSELPDDSFADEADEGEDEATEEAAVAPTEAEGEDAHAADDALGLYLRQMGAIPLLSRDQ